MRTISCKKLVLIKRPQLQHRQTGCIKTCDEQTESINKRISQNRPVVTKLDADIRAQAEKILGLPNLVWIGCIC